MSLRKPITVFKPLVEGGVMAVKSLSKHELGTDDQAEDTPGERKERLKEWETFLNVPRAKEPGVLCSNCTSDSKVRVFYSRAFPEPSSTSTDECSRSHN